ncbi:MAG: NAD(P)H-quinone oxidoreductase [Methylovirgula sp.]
MREIAFDGAGGPDVIRVREVPVPAPGPGKVLIEVVAAGVNKPDCFQRQGHYPPPPGESDVPGLEVAGRIVGVGEGVAKSRLGENVCALVGSGGYAEYAVADARLCLPVPRGLNPTEAAAIPETYFTVFDNVFTRGRLKPGETILIHGGSGGIGTTAIQLAKLFGSNVIATAGTADKCAFCRTLGADHAIDYKTQDFVAEVKAMTTKRGVDVILDTVGGAYIQKNLSLLGLEGRLVQIAFLQGSRVESFDFMPLMLKRLTMTGSTMRARSIEQKAEVAHALHDKIWPSLDRGKALPVVHATFPLKDARAAHELMESSRHLGKIVLETGK